ncbi:MAG: tRNA (uridine(34)/cytosine(34)/5-carboxymethylaminomethyluridine(34)-2'-O)-methyltransferase TrmL [Bacillota bacterium]|nr:tRNA (uridine(34)/cytosine(34)/5-carboxymethylaminomethyluridine(34)-2'-O)-methyltransferase TrmL [Bacillota bacterium]
MFNIVLVEPEIPQNTGNIARTCAATGTALHLVKPLGFSIDDKHLKRAGLDYWPYVNITVYESLDDFLEKHKDDTLFMATTKGGKNYSEVKYEDGCYILFGKETKGLPAELIKEYYDTAVRIPMGKEVNLRSLNLSNSAAVIIYEALRQNGFPELY